ncbi:copper homeostasis protein [Microbulbifer donghaiensis]|uniref:Copper homeostasis protein cutC homolog n=1 Tax=Microbulbifer donghaiensis TaxID=494016 RepID=A0A1M5I3P1_9GAMM|nr:copper homeostasis protein CutC [Microbulbifer donghaiensis]SHG22906.1 copper homeostasis protein [Microbulbifer donghaiensis]
MTLLLEICIDCDHMPSLRRSVTNALAGGAERIELCSAIALDGLTPTAEQIRAARDIFGRRAGVLAMIRPRAGDFCYRLSEIERMAEQIAMAADAGAGGVVLGALRGRALDLEALDELLPVIRGHQLSVTFHRAFDELADKELAIEQLVERGVERVLTAGAPLAERGAAADAVERINRTLAAARGRIEVVVGGGISCANILPLMEKLVPADTPLSLHSHSGLHTGGLADIGLIREMLRSIRSFRMRAV